MERISFEEKFNKKLKPIFDKHKDSVIHCSFSEVSLKELIVDLKKNTDHLNEIKKMAGII